MMNTRAYQKILREQKNRIFGYALYFLRHREDAEDVTQEVFIRLWQNWNNIDPKRMIAWMMRVAHNLCVDQVRKRRNHTLRQEAAQNLNTGESGSAADIESDPELSIELNELQRTLMTAMGSLPERTKSMLLLHYFQGLKYEEIGQILDTNVTAVKVAVHRGRKTLKQVLASQFPEKIGKCQNECAM